MMAVSFLYSLTNPLDKKLVQASDFYIYSWAYAVVSVLIFALLMAPRLLDQNVRHGPVKAGWILAAGVTDSLTVFLQFFAVSLINVVLVIAIKRAGIIVTVMAGWLVFREKHIGDRLIAASVMLAGVLMVYIPMSVRLQVLWTVFTLVSLGIALAYTREIPTLSTPSESL